MNSAAQLLLEKLQFGVGVVRAERVIKAGKGASRRKLGPAGVDSGGATRGRGVDAARR